MKLAKKSQAIEKTNGSACTVTEYSLNNALFDIATAKISGRYPDRRRVVNQQSAELAYVVAGEGKVVVNGETHLLSEGDVVVIEPGEKYYWEGDMQLFLSCRPAWNKEQHQIVD